MNSSGLIFNVQKFCVHDGPGIRTTVFLKGCPLCCVWCHNPESQSARTEIRILENRCTTCGECRRACPFGQIVAGNGPMVTDAPQCTACGECAEACPTGARQMVGERITVEALMARLRKDRMFYEDSGGGVTFSGGEPLTQPAFLQAMLDACRAEGFHTALDTCGFACTDVLLDIAARTNVVLFDLKLMDDARHLQYTGVSNKPILANLTALAQSHRNIWLRVPVIPGLNDREADWRAAAAFASTLPTIRQVNLLPYHKLGLLKTRRMSDVYPMESVEPPSAAHLERAAEIFRACGMNVKIGG